MICTMDDVGGTCLGSPHDTTPAAVIANKTYNRDPLKVVNIQCINEKVDEPYHKMKNQNYIHAKVP